MSNSSNFAINLSFAADLTPWLAGQSPEAAFNEDDVVFLNKSQTKPLGQVV